MGIWKMRRGFTKQTSKLINAGEVRWSDIFKLHGYLRKLFIESKPGSKSHPSSNDSMIDWWLANVMTYILYWIKWIKYFNNFLQ